MIQLCSRKCIAQVEQLPLYGDGRTNKRTFLHGNTVGAQPEKPKSKGEKQNIMSTINVLIVVDALGAATSGDLQSNVYLVDTNKHVGSGNEGQAELYTACVSTNKKGDTLVWSIAPVDPGSDVSINGFTGQMVQQPNPALVPTANGDGSWSGMLSPNLPVGDIQYSVNVSVDGKVMGFDPFLQVSNG